MVVEEDAPAISITDLQFRFKTASRPVLSISSWRVERDEQVFLHGESGAGKSTLLALLAGLQVSEPGSVSIMGTDLALLSARRRDRFRALHIGVVFQQFNLIPYLSVIDNVLLAAQFGDRGAPALRRRADELLEAVNLPTSLRDRPAAQLSIGQQQRVAIVRALINTPDLLLIDEPTSALDPANRDAFLDLLFEVVHQNRCAMVFVSHDPTIAERFAHRTALADLNSAEAQG